MNHSIRAFLIALYLLLVGSLLLTACQPAELALYLTDMPAFSTQSLTASLDSTATQPLPIRTATPGPSAISNPTSTQTPLIGPIPTSTAGPTPTAVQVQVTPGVCGLPPDLSDRIALLGGEINCIFWVDAYENEMGYRLVLQYDNTGELFIFETPANTTAIPLPPELSGPLDQSREYCMRRKNFSLEVYALLPDQEPVLFAGMAFDGECRLPEIPTATLPPSPLPSKTILVETLPAEPSHTASPTPNVPVDCPPADPIPSRGPADVVIVSDQQAWWWDEADGTLQPYPLPGPNPTTFPGRWIRVSEDGRFVAYQLPADQPPPASRPPIYSPSVVQRDKELWLLDRQSGQARRVAGPPPEETVQRYPDETEFYYWAFWINGSHLLGYTSHPQYNETATYEAYHLLDVDSGRTWTLFPGGEVGAVIFRPDLKQAAAIATSGGWDDPRGELRLIEVASGQVERRIPLELKYGGRWQRLSYAPDNQHLAVLVKDGVAVIDVHSGEMQAVPLAYNCQGPGSGACILPEPVWAGDGQSFTVLVDQVQPDPALPPVPETLYQVSWSADGSLAIRAGLTITTGWGMRLFSPDRRFLLYTAGQDQLEPGGDQSHLVHFLQPLKGALPGDRPIRYLEGKNFYLAGWSPDSRRFLIIEHGYDQTLGLSLGHICERPKALPLPQSGRILKTLWLDADRFLVLVLEETDDPADQQVTLYRYDLNQAEPQPVKAGAITLPVSSSFELLLVDEE